jgi:L-alanine-DL-glutamate epimerase-like enolase superfamily enzyme
VDNEWTRVLAQGILPKARFRHTSEVRHTVLPVCTGASCKTFHMCYQVIRDKMYVLGGSDNIEDVCDGIRGLGMSVLSLDSYRFVVNTTG